MLFIVLFILSRSTASGQTFRDIENNTEIRNETTTEVLGLEAGDFPVKPPGQDSEKIDSTPIQANVNRDQIPDLGEFIRNLVDTRFEEKTTFVTIVYIGDVPQMVGDFNAVHFQDMKSLLGANLKTLNASMVGFTGIYGDLSVQDIFDLKEHFRYSLKSFMFLTISKTKADAYDDDNLTSLEQ
ncbi:uncharacterized protein LOC111711714, partial [Eurytemora carolleeae]|uniref:uncharacterized protein LOC111711714 n=1 Tax=Eurytemora carolleeae TaxID=1294199 RepID=UPI000C7944F9